MISPKKKTRKLPKPAGTVKNKKQEKSTNAFNHKANKTINVDEQEVENMLMAKKEKLSNNFTQNQQKLI